MEMQLYYGEDEGDDAEVDANSPGAIVIESVSNIRTVASLNLEEERAAEYANALEKEDPHPIRSNMIKGTTTRLRNVAKKFSSLTRLALSAQEELPVWGSFCKCFASAGCKCAHRFRHPFLPNRCCLALLVRPAFSQMVRCWFGVG